MIQNCLQYHFLLIINLQLTFGFHSMLDLKIDSVSSLLSMIKVLNVPMLTTAFSCSMSVLISILCTKVIKKYNTLYNNNN